MSKTRDKEVRGELMDSGQAVTWKSVLTKANSDPRGPRPKRNLKEAVTSRYPYTQRDLADLLGVNEGEVSKWIHGKAYMPDKRVIETSVIMGVNPLFLLDIESSSTPTPPMDFDSYADKRQSTLLHSRSEVDKRWKQIQQMDDMPSKDEELARLDEEYPGDYRDMVAFTQTMLEYLPQSPAVHSSYVNGDLLAEYLGALACGVIGMTFAQ